MRKGPFAGLSWLQLIAGALAAMTSAWVASYLGVAGTIIGAAVGSLVASVASAFYISGLDRSTTFITESGSVVSRRKPAAETVEGDDDVEVLVTEDASVIAVEDSERALSWQRIALWTVAALISSMVVIGAYELATGSSFGRADNPVIGRPWQDRDPAPSPETSAPTGSTPPTAEPSAEPTTTPTSEPTTGATPDTPEEPGVPVEEVPTEAAPEEAPPQ